MIRSTLWPSLALLAAALWLPAASGAAPAHPFGNRTFIEAVKRLQPSVVHIRVKPRAEAGKTVFGFFGRGRKEKGLPRFDLGEGVPPGQFNVGSGFFVSPDGYILTNHHVVKSADEIHVRLHDGKELPARLIGADEKTDLALIKVEAEELFVPAILGDSDTVEVGEWVFAIGSPFGLPRSVSVGVISAKGRNLGEGPYDDYLQTDASINPGSSGGPLGNSRGEVIGINTAIFSQGRRAWSLGIGFAIPVNQAKAVIDDLRHRGYPVRGRLGATLGKVPDEEARRLGLGRGRGARIVEVVRGGPAHRAGLRRGDVVTKFDGKDVVTWESLARLALNDSSFQYEPETSAALGFGFRCGCLGLLHLEIVQERLEREFDLDLITTAPSVVYRITMTDGRELELHNPADYPDVVQIAKIEEPWIKATIMAPDEYLGGILSLCTERRGEQIELTYVGDRAMAVYRLPLNEVVFDFYDRLKSTSRGYASFDYEMEGYQEGELVKVGILVNGEAVDALALITHRGQAERRGRMLCERLKTLIPRQLFKIAIQAAIGGKVIARETVGALRKDVTAKCYGGDITRKRKLLEKQKKGKKRMRQFGQVEIPQSAFLEALRMDDG